MSNLSEISFRRRKGVGNEVSEQFMRWKWMRLEDREYLKVEEGKKKFGIVQ